ncbi:hypothetical protein K2173_014875 [Erythroxylum novogranatense]|uniref:Glycosyltransferase n=1 Tax=Erythroxylum novogranatense TaxID=1862640 RepID=A0AAV8TIH3_9ROSI|nr:hypothetical protein K2173_014875 [Erythroxylum novogranatense]
MDEPKQLHIAVFPWLAFGHLIPNLKLSILIAQRGHKISFISTPRNIQRLPKIPPHLALNINLVSFPLPHVEHLPPDAEATSDLPTGKIPYLKIAFDGLENSLAQFLQSSSPDWIISDFAPYWLPSIAANLKIPFAHFSIFNAWSSTFIRPGSIEDQRIKAEDFTVPPKWVPFPSKVAYRLYEAKKFLTHFEGNASGVSDVQRVVAIFENCVVIAVRSCMELEGDYINLLGELYEKPAVPVGILPPSADEDGENNDNEGWLTIKEWLDKQNKGTVVYVAFGSELTLTQDELTELAMGLELSGLPFFWVMRKISNSVEGVPLELPEEFEERNKGRGVVWTSWAPQVRIIGHESVGGFLTHCGFSSVSEALAFGRPLIMLPFALDQGLVARAIGEKGVGMEVPREENDGSYTRKSLAESLRLVVCYRH